jgi:hypothetical protein
MGTNKEGQFSAARVTMAGTAAGRRDDPGSRLGGAEH